jgi:PTH2 family peptidyl-tRNA hydrolase
MSDKDNNKEQKKCITEKEGRIKHNLMKKKGDFNSRSVITSNNNNQNIEDNLIPLDIAKQAGLVQEPEKQFYDYKMYIFVNHDLGMGKGKIAAQVGHTVSDIVFEIMHRSFTENQKSFKNVYDNFMAWRNAGQRKIVLKATQEQLEMLKQYDTARYTIDGGFTQIAPGSLTVVAFFPCKENKLPISKSELQKYKLL